jgi:hypothetical protein
MSAVLIGAITGVLLSMTTGYAITGWAFHGFQAMTPDTWRSESWRQHAMAVLLYGLAGIAVASLFEVAGAPPLGPRMGTFIGSLVGVVACCLLIQALYVRWHPLFVVGLMLEWLVFVTGVALACTLWAHAFRASW